jgi:hypothetical protein
MIIGLARDDAGTSQMAFAHISTAPHPYPPRRDIVAGEGDMSAGPFS